MQIQVAALTHYPLKAARGVALQQAVVEPLGLAHDRRWMLVDEAGHFLTQRDTPQLAQLGVMPAQDGGLALRLPDGSQLNVAKPSGRLRATVQVWQARVEAALCDAPASDLANAQLSRWLGQAVRLVYFDTSSQRFANPAWAGAHAAIGFADAYPILVANKASLAALDLDIPMNRFRANIIVAGAPAWAEDTWATLRIGSGIGSVVLDLVKPCDRCIVTTTDQESGARMGKEPLASLARLRRSADPRINGVLFGWNAVPRQLGTLQVGMPVEVLHSRPEGWPLH
jgi:uncharacterized protein YcbX